jgi:ABC-type antimicrobial peptide transport system permease subunit
LLLESGLPPILSDFRHSIRSFSRTPGVALALVFTIALGVGANLGVRGFARGLGRPSLPLPDLKGLASVFRLNAYRETGPLSYEEFVTARSQLSGFEWLGAARMSQASITIAGHTTTVPVAAVTADLAGMLGLPLGNGIVVSSRLFPDVQSSEIQIDGVPMHVSAAAPEWLTGLYRERPIDLWILFSRPVHAGATRDIWPIGFTAGARVAQAPSASLRVLPYTGVMPETAASLSRIVALLEVAAAIVFFIACANVALFLLGRAFTRFRETALRVALGAARTQLARELVADSLVVSLAGGALGVLVAVWASRTVPALLYEEDAERLVFALQPAAILAGAAVCIVITMLCGLLPILGIPHDRPVLVLRRDPAAALPIIRRLRLGLVIAQMACCCFLVISTASLIDGLRAARLTSAGQRLGQCLFANLRTPPAAGARYVQELERAARSATGVSGVTWASNLPGAQPARQWFRIEPARMPVRDVALDVDWITSGSAASFPAPKSGRMFTRADQSCRAAIVNEAAARQLFGSLASGRTVVAVDHSEPIEIVGVVPTRTTAPTIYFDRTNRLDSAPRVAKYFHSAVPTDLSRAELETSIVSPGYFEAVGARLVAGHSFDNPKSAACRIGIVNQEAADQYFDGAAIGAAIIDDRGARTTIIGVVHTDPVGSFQRHVEPALYLPMSQDASPRMTMIVRTGASNALLAADLRQKLEAVPGQAQVAVKTLDAWLNQTSLAPLHIAAVILATTAVIALLLSILGLFGALNDAARQRRRELAVRIALGAQRWRVVGQVLEEGGRPTLIGALGGMIVSFVFSRWITGITGAVSAPALWVWLAAPVALAAAVVISSLIPARGVLMVNPVMIMRDDR